MTTVMQPAACSVCLGEGFVGVVTRSFCPGCKCATCGQSTTTPPECLNCFSSGEAAAKRREDR